MDSADAGLSCFVLFCASVTDNGAYILFFFLSLRRASSVLQVDAANRRSGRDTRWHSRAGAVHRCKH